MQTPASRRAPVEAWVAGLLLVLLPVRAITLVGSGSANLGLAIAVLVSPVLVSIAWKYEERRLVGLLAVAVACGPILSLFTAGPSSGRFVDGGEAASAVLFLVNGLAQLLAVLYARQHMTDRRVAALFALGSLIHAVTTPDQWAENPWKFAFAWPVTLLVLALTGSRLGWSIAALLGLMAYTVLADSRSFLVFLVTTLSIVIWRARAERAPKETTRRRVAALVAMAALAFCAYQGTTWLSLNGHLGARNQVVSQYQEAAGGVLSNGRPEWRATLSLALDSPVGYGPGVQPTPSEGASARAELRKSVISEQYIDEYVFDNAIELHSVTSDLWFRFGLPGLASALMIGFLLARHFADLVSGPRPLALHVFVVVAAIWDLLFSPIGSNLSHVLLAVGLLACVRASDRVGVAVVDPDSVELEGLAAPQLEVQRQQRRT